MKKLHIKFERDWDQVTLKRHWFPISFGYRPRVLPNIGGGHTFTWLWLEVWTTERET